MTRFDTKKLHAGYNPLEHNGAVSVPIYATAAFEMGTVAHSDDMFSFDSWDALYSRLSNPTTDVLEARLIEYHSWKRPSCIYTSYIWWCTGQLHSGI